MRWVLPLLSLLLLAACGGTSEEVTPTTEGTRATPKPSASDQERVEALEYIQARYDIDIEMAEAHHLAFEMIEGAEEADFYDPAWQEEVVQAIGNVKTVLSKGGELEPPDCLQALHDYYIGEDQLFDESMTLLAEGLTELDNDKIRRSDELKTASGQDLTQRRTEGWGECGLTEEDLSGLKLDWSPPPD